MLKNNKTHPDDCFAPEMEIRMLCCDSASNIPPEFGSLWFLTQEKDKLSFFEIYPDYRKKKFGIIKEVKKCNST